MKNAAVAVAIGCLLWASALYAQAPPEPTPLTVTKPEDSVSYPPTQVTPDSPTAELQTDNPSFPTPPHIMNRMESIEKERIWVVGLIAGLGFGITVLTWLRREIVRKLVQDAFPSATLWDQARVHTWRPNRPQWAVMWISSAVISTVFVLLPGKPDTAARLLIALSANAILLLFALRDRR